jgi:hypothetical protein
MCEACPHTPTLAARHRQWVWGGAVQIDEAVIYATESIAVRTSIPFPEAISREQIVAEKPNCAQPRVVSLCRCRDLGHGMMRLSAASATVSRRVLHYILWCKQSAVEAHIYSQIRSHSFQDLNATTVFITRP